MRLDKLNANYYYEIGILYVIYINFKNYYE
ncbi:hypothetical protein [Clostridium estertheticum]